MFTQAIMHCAILQLQAIQIQKDMSNLIEITMPKNLKLVWNPGCLDTQHIDTQHNDTRLNLTQHNYIQYNDTQYEGLICDSQHKSLNITTLCRVSLWCVS
jgi:hypothetical protein